MGPLWRLFFFCVVGSALAMEDFEKPLVLVGANSVIEQGVWARTKIIAQRVGLLNLPIAAFQAFGIADMFDEPSGRKKFFEFLRNLTLEEKLANQNSFPALSCCECGAEAEIDFNEFESINNRQREMIALEEL